ncbi:MAG: BrxA/BrxB family bacilliredoxin [Acidobacteriaceae bacterium]|nr:BrxA/BrxB family bacilliredoxin [Acidobacteriaceae bacterium]MBV9297010.1 BrxA/BrxB family bacilliredoxin [Acidobacteriaceae bacterium]MBV9766271.1 BrxA/BrxB family bacilliredoxin [Acidobacteriaceae bacterium]
MRYPEQLIALMREDLRQYGVQETRTPEEVDRALKPGGGTVLMVINSVCGCAAGKARPAVGMALAHHNHPESTATVFAGADLEAVARVRELLPGAPPSSPSMALFRDGKPVFMLHRHEIESRQAPEIAKLLTEAFDQYCVTATK